MEKPTPLPGTVKLYERHLFICSGRTDWPERIEQGGGFAQALAEALAPRLDDMPQKVKVTACDEPSLGRPAAPGQGHDLLVFPDGLRYLGLQTGEIQTLVDDHLIGSQPSRRLPYSLLEGWHVFVCVHNRRDERCGLCGPPLVARFQAELDAHGLADRVTLRRSSHVGGHAFAGNVLIYPGGDWYGCVTPEDVPRIVERHLEEGRIVADLWRGRMSLSPEEQILQSEHWSRLGSD